VNMMNRSRVMNDRWYSLSILNMSTFRYIHPIYKLQFPIQNREL
jgi:hypothetical protein